tara:strand:+ start:903 stop:1067 length:165 start_codon:yes stop_codon:yes gene_type:complete
MEDVLCKILDQVEVIDDLIDTGTTDDLQEEVDILWAYLVKTKHDQWVNSLWDWK